MNIKGGLLNFAGQSAERSKCSLQLVFEIELKEKCEVVEDSSIRSIFCSGASVTNLNSENNVLAVKDRYIINWYGRLDNRCQLEPRLNSAAAHMRCDVDIVSELYQQFGIAGLSSMIGDFAFSIWDINEGTLYLARDPFGCRPLFYRNVGSSVVWSRDIRAMLQLVDNYEIDDEYAAGFITFAEEPGRTPYKQIRSVEPGYVVQVNKEKCRKYRLWEIAVDHELAYASDARYEEEFRALFCQSIEARLRSDGPVTAELSGGLDSSSIVCMADSILSKSGNSPQLQTISYMYDGSLGSIETAFIEEVERGRTVPKGHRIYDHRILEAYCSGAAEAVWWRPNPFCCFLDTFNSARNFMSAHGSRALLSGFGGDHILMADSLLFPELEEFARHGKLLRMWQHLNLLTQATGISWTGLIWENLFLPHLSCFFRTRCLRDMVCPPWLNRKYADNAGCFERTITLTQTAGSYSQRFQYLCLHDAVSMVSQNYYSDFDIEATYPFLHRSLVEFLLRVPVSQKVRPYQNRSLHRRSLVGVLPEKIRSRTSKGGPDEALYRSFSRYSSRFTEIIDASRLCAIGYVNRQALKEAIRRAQYGLPVALPYLHRTVTYLTWLHHFERRQSRPEMQAKAYGVTRPYLEPALIERGK